MRLGNLKFQVPDGAYSRKLWQFWCPPLHSKWPAAEAFTCIDCLPVFLVRWQDMRRQDTPKTIMRCRNESFCWWEKAKNASIEWKVWSSTPQSVVPLNHHAKKKQLKNVFHLWNQVLLTKMLKILVVTPEALEKVSRMLKQSRRYIINHWLIKHM